MPLLIRLTTPGAQPLAIDPDTTHPHLLRRPMIMKQTLRYMQYFFLPDPFPALSSIVLVDMLQQIFKIPQTRLIAADSFRCKDAPEVHAL